MSNNLLKGSQWRKWDLHIHSPYSIIHDYGNSTEQAWEQFISELEGLPKEFKVIGINDYMFLDGYEKILEYKKKGRLDNLDLILPVLEFRIEKLAGIDFGKLKRINLHVIFSNEIENGVETIKSQFLNSLEQSYIIDKDNKEWSRAITRESLAALGRKIKENVPPKKLSQYGTDLEEGFKNLNVKENKIFELLNRDVFKEKYLIAIGKTEWDSLKWTDSSIGIKKDIINRAHIVFTASSSPEVFKLAKKNLTEQKVNDLLLDCSDSHSFSSSENKDRIGNCFTWLKSDTTFEGLKQILYEYEERVFIGDTPEIIERVANNRTKFIKEIKITNDPQYFGDKGIWFQDICIPMNSGMVAIIGNKGSGKSALADIIGLCGNSHSYKDFSFLNFERFLKNNLARNFNASIIWANDEESTKNLMTKVDYNAPERVKYLPQNFFDRLTNNLDNYDFQSTLEDIVFSYLPDEEKLGRDSFNELIEFKKESISKDVDTVIKEIIESNKNIIALEYKSYPGYKEKIENELEIKLKELNEHIKAKPGEIKNPELDEDQKEHNKEVTAELEEQNSRKDSLAKEIEEKKTKKITLNREIQELENIREDFKRLQVETKSFLSTKESLLTKYNISIENIFKLEIDLTSLEKVIESKKTDFKKIREMLHSEEEIKAMFASEEQNPLIENSLIVKLVNVEAKIGELKGQLSAPFKLYQGYLEKLKSWESRKKELEGDKDTYQSVTWYKAELKYLSDSLPKQIKIKRKERIEKSKSIFDKKIELINIYNKLKTSVDEEIKGYKNVLGDYDINIDVSLKVKTDFSTDFLSFINQNKKGSFFQIEEGRTRIERIANQENLQNKEDLEEFLKVVIENLEHDKRDGYNNERRFINEQISDDNLIEFYKYLFSLEYLIPSYALKLGDKQLTELSPGEKGAMLIVFYLMLDKSNIPLIIDQPEENLDNESIYKILVHFIRDTKKRRQVILVTHNPNLAIVGDAEQIIYVNIDKKNRNKFSCESGAIENPIINMHASDILEGTLKAFGIRRLKYFNKLS